MTTFTTLKRNLMNNAFVNDLWKPNDKTFKRQNEEWKFRSFINQYKTQIQSLHYASRKVVSVYVCNLLSIFGKNEKCILHVKYLKILT